MNAFAKLCRNPEGVQSALEPLGVGQLKWNEGGQFDRLRENPANWVRVAKMLK